MKATLNRVTLSSLATTCIALTLGLAMAPAAAQDAARRVGTLTCNLSPGVGLVVGGQRQLSCIYATAVPRPAVSWHGRFLHRPRFAGRRWREPIRVRPPAAPSAPEQVPTS